MLERACPECGFDTRHVTPQDLPDLLRANTAAWQAVLSRPDARARPSPGVWSPSEYACHVRDVFSIFTQRLHLMLTEDDPLFENWDQDATALEHDYRSREPAEVAGELARAGVTAAAAFAAVPDDAWTRTGRRSDGARFTVETLGRYFVHDPVHHLWDVGAPGVDGGRS